MGKVKQVIMGDIKAEEKARKREEVKREQKKLAKKKTIQETVKEETKAVSGPPPPRRRTGEVEGIKEKGGEKAASDLEKSAEILKLLEEEEKKEAAAPKEKPAKKAKAKPAALLEKAKHGRKYQQAAALIDRNKLYPPIEAINLIQKTSYTQFNATIEGHFNVTEKGLRGTVSLPHGTGKEIKVAIATDELINQLTPSASLKASAPPINFDVLVAHPAMMSKLAKVARILGPRGLMPNPKTGTIGENVEELALRLRSGQYNWKTESEAPLIHAVIGKASFSPQQLEENLAALVKSIGKDKIKALFVKATMGPAIKVAV